MVNEINMAKWIVALRSGKYEQARGMLRDDDAFCCLGVACDVSHIGMWDGLFYETDGEAASGVLPSPVVEWLGLPSSNPSVTSGVSSADANDVFEWDFPRIAAALESRYLPGKKAEEILAGAS